MKTKLLSLIAVFAVVSPVRAADASSDTLQKGLFEEEANHDLDAAIRAYQAITNRFADQRKVAATAVFRLGECYRKLGKTNEANAQYQRVWRDFADQPQLVKLSRECLGSAAAAAPMAVSAATPGAPPPIVADGQTYYPATEAEAAELQRIIALTKDSPDLVNGFPTAGSSPLHNAADKDELAVAQFLLAHGVDINAKSNPDRSTPLFSAAYGGHKTMVELLVAHGADINAAGVNHETPLHISAALGFKSVVEVLLAHGADVNAKGTVGSTPLHSAAGRGLRAISEDLLAHGADVNSKDDNGMTPLYHAVG